MRFVEWNCCGGFASKMPTLIELGCELAVLCEVPETSPASTLLDPEVDWHWAGHSRSKGLAIASFGARLTRTEAREGAGLFTVAAETASGIGVLGVWTTRPMGSSYVAQAKASIDCRAGWLRETPSIIAGDFNVAPLGSVDRRSGALRQLFDDVEALGYRSVYHHVFGEAYGAETRPTYYHRRKAAERFHIDLAFLHVDLLPQLRGFEVGAFDRWVAPRAPSMVGPSDHVPLILDLDI